MFKKQLRLNLMEKLSAYLLLISIVPLVVLGFLSYSLSNAIIHDETAKFATEMLLEKKDYMELMMEEVESLIDNLSSIEEIQQAVSLPISEKNIYMKRKTQAKIGYILGGYTNLKGLVSIDIFSVDGIHHHVGDTLDIEKINEQMKSRLFQEAVNSGTATTWMGIENNVNLKSSHNKVITAVRGIYLSDPQSGLNRFHGIIVINYDINVFYDYFARKGYYGNEAYLMVVDDEERIVFHPDKNKLGTHLHRDFMEFIERDSHSFITKLDNEKVGITYYKSPKTGWTLMSFVPLKILHKKTVYMAVQTTILLAISLTMVFLFMMMLSKSVVVPIKKITSSFKRLKSGTIDLEHPLKEGGNDEIGELIRWFNTFLESLKEKKITENRLIESREQYRSVINNVKEVIFQTDTLGLWTFLNPAWLEIMGFTMEESLGKSFLDYIHYEDQKNSSKLFQLLITGKAKYNRNQVRYIKKDGSICWIEVLTRPTLDQNNKIIGTSGTLRDITVHKNMEEEIKNKDRLLHGIAQATKILIGTTDYESGFNEALRILGEVTAVDRVYIFEQHVHSKSEELAISQCFEWCREGVESQINNPDLQDIPYKSFGLMRWYKTLSSGNSITGLIKDFPPLEKEILEPQGIISILVVPIIIEEKMWGFIGFDDCCRERRWSKIEETTLLAAAANIGGTFTRMEAEEALQRALKNDFRQTVQNLQNLVFKLKRNGDDRYRFTLFEGKMAAELGLTTDIVLGKTADEIFPIVTAEIINDYYEKAFKGMAYNFEIEYKERIFYVTLSPIYEGDGVVEVVGSAIDITTHKEAEDKIKYMAYYDTLTGLPNRALLKERMDGMITNDHGNKQIEMSLMFLDLDRFKIINDTLGHTIGDLLLKAVSKRLLNCVSGNDMVCRMGGDEFILVFPGISSKNRVELMAQKVLEALRNPFLIEGHEFYITTSIGISLYPSDGEDMDTLIKNADTAMYRAKALGRNNYQFYTIHMNERAIERLDMEGKLRKAIEKEEFFLVYQPQVDMVTGCITGSEALIRWVHPTLGMISPAEFIPLAEETGLIVPIGEWVLYEACLQNKIWQDFGYEHLSVSVNVSAQQFHQQNLVETIKRILKATNLDPSYLKIEITENIIMQNTERTRHIMKELKEMGIHISIDDFGTGFSSLSYLKRFDVDILKIDQSFIHEIITNNNDAAITTTIINMAHNLNLSVIAEGVETEEQLEFLKSRNCDMMQGFLFSKPVAPDEFLKILKEENLYCLQRSS